MSVEQAIVAFLRSGSAAGYPRYRKGSTGRRRRVAARSAGIVALDVGNRRTRRRRRDIHMSL